MARGPCVSTILPRTSRPAYGSIPLSGITQPCPTYTTGHVPVSGWPACQATAASKVVQGSRAATRLATGIARRADGQLHTRVAWINGEPGVLVLHGEHLHAAMALVSDGQRIHRIYSVVNPHKLLQAPPGAPR